MAVATHEYSGVIFWNGEEHASCTCGWSSRRHSDNLRKSWAQHVTRGT